MPKLATCLWFEKGEAEQAAKYYTSIFKKSKMGRITRWGNAGPGMEYGQGKPGSVLCVEFELDGSRFLALNGNAPFKFNEAISIQVPCKTEKELDYYWRKLTAGGDKNAQQCGWLKDKYGVSWQVFPEKMPKMLTDKDRQKADRVMTAMCRMKKIDTRAIERAYAGLPE
jgi:predicted 3-demethylubiquinone-9 3-methyltransferase (glyoxalase superfamily)